MVYSLAIMRTSTGLALFMVLASAACGGKTPLPKGPPPEYEDEPAPSASAAATQAQGATPPSPAASGPSDGGAGG